MKFEQNGVTLDFKMPQTVNDTITVRQCPPGKTPQWIGTITQVHDQRTGQITYYPTGLTGGLIGNPTCDWQQVELEFVKYAKHLNRDVAERFLIGLNDRMRELTAIRQRKALGVSKEKEYNH